MLDFPYKTCKLNIDNLGINMLKSQIQLLVCCVTLLLTACSNHGPSQEHFQKDILDGINVGMEKNEIIDILGTPHEHPFNNNLWIYQLKLKDKRYNAVLYFNKNKLVRIEKVSQ